MPITLRKLATLSGHQARVWHVSWSPDGKSLATCGEDWTARIWEEKSAGEWECKCIVKEHSGTVRRVEWSPDGSVLGTCSFDRKTVLNLITKTETGYESTVGDLIEGHSAEIKAIAFSRDHLLATCSRDRMILIWRDKDPECEAYLRGHTQDIKYVTWHPVFQHLLVSASYDNSIRFWLDPVVSTTEFSVDDSESGENEWPCVEIHEDHTSTVWDVCFEAPVPNYDDALKAALADPPVVPEPEPIKIPPRPETFDEEEEDEEAEQKRVEQLMADSKLPPDASAVVYHGSTHPRMISASSDGSVIVWVRPRSNRPYRVGQRVAEPFHGSVIYSVSWRNPFANSAWAATSKPLTPLFATASGDNTLRLFVEDPATGKFQMAAEVPDAHQADVNCVRFNPVKSNILATCGDDNLVHIWEIQET